MKVDNSLWHTNLFKNKKALVLVPHEDDELFLAGTVIVELKKMGCEVIVAFSTNGDNGQNAHERIIQSIRALKKLNVNKSDIFFLGYGDQYVSEYGHLYHAPQKEVVRSKAGHTETYGISAKEDWCYQKHGYHRQYTSDGFLKDIEELLITIRPDIIFCNDMDWHPDHRALSLSFDRAMGKILKNDHSYTPYIYKGFVYFVAWDAPLDYDRINPALTKRPSRFKLFNPKHELENPYFFWKDRVRFPVSLDLLYKNGFHNPIFLAVRQYKFSEHAYRYAKGAINSDQIFWQRRTDNLALGADIFVSSGTADFINDFMILDSSNICRMKNIIFDKGVWTPNETDDRKCVYIHLHKYKKLEKVMVYRGVGFADDKLTVNVFHNECSEDKHYLLGTSSAEKNQLIIPILLNNNYETDKICLQFIGSHIGISEIEVYEQSRHESLPFFIKAQINGNFAYVYHITNEKQLFLNIYQYTVGGHISVKYDIKYKIYGVSGKKLFIDHNQIKLSKGFISAYIKFYVEKNPLIYDIIKIMR